MTSSPFYRLVALDADGTLFDQTLTVRPAVKEAIAQAQARGVIVTVATGRAFVGARIAARQINANAPVICYQGGLIQHPQTEAVIYEATFPKMHIARLMAWARPLHLQVTVYVSNVVYLEEFRHEHSFYDLWFGLPMQLVDRLETALPGDPTKFLIIGEAPQLDALQPQLEALFAGTLDIVRSHPWFLEGVPPGVSKGNALSILADKLGIPQSQVIAVGDAPNDISMLKWAGLGVAMGQAPPEVKAAADWIAPPFEEDGVVAVFRRFILNGTA